MLVKALKERVEEASQPLKASEAVVTKNGYTANDAQTLLTDFPLEVGILASTPSMKLRS